MPGLARDLCWHQFDAFATAGPYGEATAKIALQPLVNLARLRIRDGDDSSRLPDPPVPIPRRAIAHGARPRRRPGHHIATLIATGGTRATMAEWLWAILLTDGLRALCKAGRWTDAADQARQHDGIGKRLLGGRQAQILALAAAGRSEEAGQVLEQTSASEPWEHTVAACLQALIQDPCGESSSRASAEMTSTYLGLDDPDHPMFMACLGLAAGELAVPGDSQHAILSEVARIATQSQDAYIARELLSSPVSPGTRPQALAQLREMVRQSGLGQLLTADQSRLLSEAVASSAAVLANRLSARQ